jgi:hypothetical protein
MKLSKTLSISFMKGTALALLLAAATGGQASTIWNGPNIGFYHTQENGLQDQMTSNVKLTRGSGGGLYNAAVESGAVPGTSPKGTLWAVGTLANFSTLSYGPCPLEQGSRPPNDIGKTYVVHLVTNDIYLQLTLTNWGGAGGGGDKTFGYTRSTAPVVVVPNVTITSPASGAVFAAPASVGISANATVSSGTVTNVQFFTNGVSCGSTALAPFNLTANNLAAGAYALTAAATAAGISATSAVVNITVIAPPMVSLTNPVSGAVFAAPASLKLNANATVAGGTVTNVQFFANSNPVGVVSSAPFNLATSGLAAGAYSLAAVATAAGISATSAVVNVTVVNPVSVTLGTASRSAPTEFEFSYAANVGLSYVVQRSTNLLAPNWQTLATNVATANPASFMDVKATNGPGFYRVGLLPNP